MFIANFSQAPSDCNNTWTPPASFEASVLYNNCSVPLHQIRPIIMAVIQLLSLINALLHLVSLLVFIKIIRSKIKCQVIHYYLVFLSVYEVGLMLSNFTKLPLYSSGWILSKSSIYSDLEELVVVYQVTMVIKVLSACFSCCRNWWLVVIALLRCFTILRLACQGANSMMESKFSALRYIVYLFVFISLSIVAIFTVIYAYILPNAITIIYCKLSAEDIVIFGFKNHNTINRGALELTHELIFFIIPFSIMLIVTIILWIALQHLNRSSQLRSQINLRIATISKTVGILMTVFLLLELPFSITLFLNYSQSLSWCSRMVSLRLAMTISDFFASLDSTANILVYYYWDPTYKKICRKLFEQCRVHVPCIKATSETEPQAYSMIETVRDLTTK